MVLLAFLSLFIILEINGYIVDEHNNCTNVENALNPPTPYVTFLGNFSSTKECMNECIKQNCDSYTYYNNKQCWSYINNTIWLPYKSTSSNCGRIIYPCNNDMDCSLNGECNTNTGNCTCRKGWYGYKCHFMSLLPANKSAGYLSPFGSYNETSWGGSVAYDTVTDKYVMLVTDMQNNCGIDSWRRNCEIIYAQTVDNNWNSQFIKKSVLIIPFSCTPDIIYAPDTDEFVLFYVVNTTWDEIPPCVCIDGSTSSNCVIHQNVSETTAFITIKANDLSSGYDLNKWSSPINIEGIGHGDSNFAAVINNDSSLVGMIRGRLVTATNWKNNETYKVYPNTLFPYLVKSGTEDFYLYKDCNGYYHALFHNMDPNDDQTLCGAHAYSMDGVNWIYGGLAFNNSVSFTDATKFIFKRRERPHLIFDVKDNCTPVALTSAAEYGDSSQHDKSYTLLQPINH